MLRLRRILGRAFVLFVALGTALAFAEGTAKEEKKAAPQKEEKVAAKTEPQTSPYMAAAKKKPRPAGDEAKVFTNEDLAALGRGGLAVTPDGTSDIPPTRAGAAPSADRAEPVAPSEAGEAAAPPSTALERMRKERAEAAERQQRIANAEAEIARLAAKIDNLKRQQLAVVNPFSARPDWSEKQEELRQSGAPVADRKSEAQQELSQAEQQLREARQELADARAGRPAKPKDTQKPAAQKSE